MPLALDPQATFDVVLESDADKPVPRQPAFVCRYLSGRELREVAAAQDALEDAVSGAEAIDRVFDQIRRLVAGWRNMTRPPATEGGEPEVIGYDPQRLDELLTIAEAQELVQKAMAGGVRIEAEDSKKSASESPSSTD